MSDVDHIVQARRDYTRRRRLAFYYSARLHPEALDWQSRILAAGSSVSASTLQAASDFCGAIDAAGIRDRFVRLNLFAGNDLTAALVPLYRSDVPFAITGGAIDIGVNFIGSDYTETGASAGIKGNASTKYVDSTTPWQLGASRHVAVWLNGTAESTPGVYIGRCADGSNNELTIVQRSAAFYVGRDAAASASANTALAGIPATGISILATSSLTDSVVGWINTSSTAPSVYTLSANSAGPVSVFGMRRADNMTIRSPSDALIAGYSIGRNLTPTIMTAYRSAQVAFLDALGRPTP
jgi:hypothetical protein